MDIIIHSFVYSLSFPSKISCKCAVDVLCVCIYWSIIGEGHTGLAVDIVGSIVLVMKFSMIV